MNCKRIFMTGTMSLMMGVSTVTFAGLGDCGKGSYKGFCLFQDVLAAVANYALDQSKQKLINPIYDITKGLRRIQSNIGQFQDQGDCGISATGNSGCTDAKNMAAAMGGATGEAVGASAITEAGSTVLGGTQVLLSEKEELGNMSDLDAQYLRLLGKKHGNTFDKIRANVTNHVFETDEQAINADCTCSAGKGASCSTAECAQYRQNQLLIRSSTTASAAADSWLKDFSDKSVYSELNKVLAKIQGAKSISSFVGSLSNLSYNASILAINQMALMTSDLRAQSYRNLIYSGVTQEALPTIGGGIQ